MLVLLAELIQRLHAALRDHFGVSAAPVPPTGNEAGTH